MQMRPEPRYSDERAGVNRTECMECQGVAAERGWNVLIGQGCPAVDEVSLRL